MSCWEVADPEMILSWRALQLHSTCFFAKLHASCSLWCVFEETFCCLEIAGRYDDLFTCRVDVVRDGVRVISEDEAEFGKLIGRSN